MKNYFVVLILFSLTAFAEDFDAKILEISNLKNSDLLLTIGQFGQLEKLTIMCLEDLKELPNSIGELKNLKELNMNNGKGCSMNSKLPDSIGNLTQLQVLNLSGAQDPRGGGKKMVGARHQLPKSLAKIKTLETLDLSRNGYSKIPPVVAQMPALKHLRLNFNSLDALPPWLAKSSIVKISLGDNCKITSQPQKQKEIAKRFPRIQFDFSNEYDCVGQRKRY